MTANVHCIGQPDPLPGERENPCGWTAPVISDPDEPWTDEEAASWAASKSCPSCGGRVELMPQEAGS